MSRSSLYATTTFVVICCLIYIFLEETLMENMFTKLSPISATPFQQQQQHFSLPNKPSTFYNEPLDDSFSFDFLSETTSRQRLSRHECLLILSSSGNISDPSIRQVSFSDIKLGFVSFRASETKAMKAFDQKQTFGCSLFELVFGTDFPSVSAERQFSHISVLSTASGVDYLMKWWMSLWNRAVYCRTKHYTCLVSLVPASFLGKRSAYYVKLPGIATALRFSKHVLFVDLDAFFTENSINISTFTLEQFIPQNSSAEVSVVFGNWALPWINTGLMLFARTSFNVHFLHSWWELGVTVIDQPSLWHLLFQRFQTMLDAGELTSSNQTFSYSSQLIDGCLGYSPACRWSFRDWWKYLFATERIAPGQYDFIYVHPSTPSQELPLFHCVHCKQGNQSLVYHTGSTNLRLMQQLHILDQEVLVTPPQTNTLDF